MARLLAATALIPAMAWGSYIAARYVDGDPTAIDWNGSALGVALTIISVFLIARVTSAERWSERAGISLGLSAAYFLLTWARFGDPTTSIDVAPHLVWYGACVLAFAPAVVLIVASEWAWESFRTRRAEFYAPAKAQT